MQDKQYLLSNRSVLKLEGSEALSFLERILTCRTENLTPGEIRFGALLTPQGKILSDLFVYTSGDHVYLDLPDTTRDDILKRLTLLKLRSDVQISHAEDLSVVVSETSETGVGELAAGTDTRMEDGPRRCIAASADLEDGNAAYFDLRVEHILPECGTEYGPSEVFPADVNMDLLNGVDFQKGCFVGQEVVSRMKRKTEVRKRTCRISGSDISREQGAEIRSESSSLGNLLSSDGEKGLALMRLDRLAKAQEQNDQPAINGSAVIVTQPKLVTS